MKINARRQNMEGKELNLADLQKLGLNGSQIHKVISRHDSSAMGPAPRKKASRQERENLRKRLMFLGLSDRVDEFL